MAIYRFEAKLFSREKRGRSVVAAAAYRAGSKLKDERQDHTHDYTRRQPGIIQSVILAPEGAPEWARKSEELWNNVERGEKSADAQLAREFILSLPYELNEKQQWETAVGWAQAELVNKGMTVEVSLHRPKKGKNVHAHMLCTLRKFDGENFCAKKAREWNEVGLLVEQRESWAKACNAALDVAGRVERVDHRSLKDQGVDREPEPKIGVAATAMKRKGRISDLPIFEYVRNIRFWKDVAPMLRPVAPLDEIEQIGGGATFWERSASLVARARDRTQTAIKGAWEKFLESRQPKEGKDGPDISR